MGKLSMLIVVAMLMAFILGNEGRNMQMQVQTGNFQVVETNDVFAWLCQNNPIASAFDWCAATTAIIPAASSTPPIGTTQVVDSTTQAVTTTTVKSSSTVQITSTTPAQSSSTVMSGSVDTTTTPTALQRAYWCQFDNGTYVSLGQTFYYTSCLLCQCTQTRDIRCHSLQCQATQCTDGTTAVVQNNQCCPTCVTDTSTSCVYGGITFPQGSIIQNNVQNLQCSCQSGSIQCFPLPATTTTAAPTTTKKGSLATLASVSYLSDVSGSNNTTVYIIIVIICVLVILASLLCCGCAVVYYYYYYQNQQTAQQAYDQYFGSAGWQPMGEDGQVIDESALEKQAEAEKSQNQNEENYPTGNSQQYIPPPYAAYNGPYANGDQEKN